MAGDLMRNLRRLRKNYQGKMMNGIFYLSPGIVTPSSFPEKKFLLIHFAAAKLQK